MVCRSAMRSRTAWALAAASSACGLLLGGLSQLADACTTIAVGKNATIDGSTIATHNADCLDCDFRLGKVPARDWPAGSMRPVVKFRAEYPRTVSEDRGLTWTPDHLDSELPQRGDWTNETWRDDMILGYIPQVNHTFAYLEGLYAIINEKQVAIGESTCSAKWFAGPLSDDCETCNSMLDISELSRIALERSSTAREAIQVMGDLAVEYGFYGSEWDASDPLTYQEAGEALTVTDAEEAWVFHIMSDDTTTSAIWAAQRVPDDHITVVANQFIIKEIYPDADPEFWMYSENLFEVAERGGCGYKRGSGFPLHFEKAFTLRIDDFPHYAYTTRRIWRVFDVFAPSLGLSPYTDTLEQTYPFSVKPDELVSTQDVLRIVRDHYEGTEFDMSQGIAAGPFGDVDRYDYAASLDGSSTMEDAKAGFYERSISIFRTSYSSVTQSRAHLPDEVGALLWVAQYKPSMSTFIPLYVNVHEVPLPYTIGSLLRFNKEVSYWAFSVVGNWAERFRMFAHVDVVEQQATLENPLFDAQEDFENDAADLIADGDFDGARGMLTQISNASAVAAVSAYHTLFDTLVARYHDGYQMQDPTAETVGMKKMFYPRWWLDLTGYFNSRQNDADNIKEIWRACGVPQVEAPGAVDTRANVSGAKPPPSEVTGETKVGLVLGALLFTMIGVAGGRWSATRSGYSNLAGP